jgi:hypothetical protein
MTSKFEQPCFTKDFSEHEVAVLYAAAAYQYYGGASLIHAHHAKLPCKAETWREGMKSVFPITLGRMTVREIVDYLPRDVKLTCDEIYAALKLLDVRRPQFCFLHSLRSVEEVNALYDGVEVHDPERGVLHLNSPRVTPETLSEHAVADFMSLRYLPPMEPGAMLDLLGGADAAGITKP